MDKKNLPNREIALINEYTCLNDIYKKNQLKSFNNLEDELNNVIESYEYNTQDKARYYYIISEKKDSILVTQEFYNSLKERSKSNIILNPPFDDISKVINKKKLKIVAKEWNIWEKTSLINRENIGKFISACISVFFSIISCFISFLDLDNEKIETMKALVGRPIQIGLIIFLSIITLVIVGLLIRSNENISFKRLKQAINEESFNYIGFINAFSSEDFISLEPENEYDKRIMICSLKTYSTQQLHILKQYLRTNRNCDLWILFVERNEASKKFILSKSQYHIIKHYYLKPLSNKEKKNLAKDIGMDYHDPGIKPYGIDYIFAELLQESKIRIKDDITDRINVFCKEKKEDYHFDIRTLISVVADLSINYQIDLNSSVRRETLFNNRFQGDGFNKIDREITKRLFFSSKEIASDADLILLKQLIPQIIKEFYDDFNDIIAIEPFEMRSTEYIQFCLIKALKNYCQYYNEDGYLAIADILFNIFNSSEDYMGNYNTREWLEILFAVLSAFDKVNFYWYTPFFIHCLISIREAVDNKLVIKVFSKELIKKIAKKNLLLNIYTTFENANVDSIDVVVDHYKVLVFALQEDNKNNVLIRHSELPNYFELLTLNYEEKKQYFNVLNYFNDNTLQLFEYLYSIYFSTLSLSNDTCYYNAQIYNNTRSGIDIEQINEHIISTIKKIIELLDNDYADNEELKNELFYIKELVNTKREEAYLEDYCLFLLLKFDYCSTTVLTYIVSLLCCVMSNIFNLNDIHFECGSTLFQFIFLTLKEQKISEYNEDFLHLVNILEKHISPCSLMIGQVASYSAFIRPQNQKKRLLEYLKQHQELLNKNLEEMASIIKSEDIEGFINDILLIPSDGKYGIYKILRNKLLLNNTVSGKTDFLNEFLTLLIDKKSTSTYEQKDALDIINELKEHMPNTVYFMYDQYLKLNKNEFVNLCPFVAEIICQSNITYFYRPILFYIKNADDYKTEYFNVIHLLYDRLINDAQNKMLLTYNLDIIKDYFDFYEVINQEKQEYPDQYFWVDESENAKFISCLKTTRRQLLIIEVKEALQEASWKRYGLLSYIKHILLHSDFTIKNNGEYNNLTEAEKVLYIKENYNSILPYSIIGISIEINQEYIDMIDLFLRNTDNIQKDNSEYELSIKLIHDLKIIVNEIVVFSQSEKEQINKMIDEYLWFIRKI